MEKYVAYYRVSTAKQGKSGLGLAAQKETIRNFIGSDKELVAEFEEIQSGRKDNREQLNKALCLAKREKARLLIARLDRFSRRVSFIANIMDEGIGLTVAEMPTATDFQLHIFAALAQEERRLISERTKSALREAKRRGAKLGQNGKILAILNKQRYREFKEIVIRNLPENNCFTKRSLASKLKTLEVKSINGKILSANLLDRYLEK